MNEAQYWRQRYETLMATFSDAVKTAMVARPPVILADKESYEAGRVAGMAEQRKPLTLVELSHIFASIPSVPFDGEWQLELARAIEAAHGIKGEA